MQLCYLNITGVSRESALEQEVEDAEFEHNLETAIFHSIWSKLLELEVDYTFDLLNWENKKISLLWEVNKVN